MQSKVLSWPLAITVFCVLWWRFSNVIDRTVNLSPQMRRIYLNRGWNWRFQRRRQKNFTWKSKL